MSQDYIQTVCCVCKRTHYGKGFVFGSFFLLDQYSPRSTVHCAKIFWKTIPFAIVTTLVLLSFAVMYHLERSKRDGVVSDGYDTLGESFLSVIGSFVGGPDG